MKKVITVVAILFAIGTIALFVLQLQRNGSAEPAPGTTGTAAPEQTVPTTGESTEPEAPEYTFPKDQPLPTGTQPSQKGEEDVSIPTAAPGLDEDETPHMEV